MDQNKLYVEVSKQLNSTKEKVQSFLDGFSDKIVL